MYSCSSFAMSRHECKFKSLKSGLLHNAIMAQTLRCHGQGSIGTVRRSRLKKSPRYWKYTSTSQQPVEGSATCSELVGPRTRENMRWKGLKFDGWLGSEEPGASYCWHLYVFPGEVIQIPHTLMLGWMFSPWVRNWLTRTCYSVHKGGLLGTSKIKVIISNCHHIDLPFRCFLCMHAFWKWEFFPRSCFKHLHWPCLVAGSRELQHNRSLILDTQFIKQLWMWVTK